jgi:hypothetical protein
MDPTYYEKNYKSELAAEESKKYYDIENAKNQKLTTTLLDALKKFENIDILVSNENKLPYEITISKDCKSALFFKDDCCDTVTKFVSAFTRAVANVYINHSVSEFTPLSQYGMSFNVKRNFFDSCKKTLPTELDSFLNLIGKNQDFFTRLAPIEDNNSRETMSNFNRDSMYEPSTAAAGGYHSRRKRRTSKKSRKSRPRCRSSHNKKRHTKRHTKRYRNRK